LSSNREGGALGRITSARLAAVAAFSWNTSIAEWTPVAAIASQAM
jgi:hypothetical protein